MASHFTLQDLLPFNSKLARLSVDKFPPLALVRSQKFSSICPSYLEYKLHSHSGEGRLVMCMSLINERLDVISDEARHAIFQCFLCGGCDISVKLHSDIETLAGMYALRAESFRRAGPLPGHRRLLERMDEVGHPLFEEGGKGDWLREAGLEAGLQAGHEVAHTAGRGARLKAGLRAGINAGRRARLKAGLKAARDAGTNGAAVLLFVGDRYALVPRHRKTLLNLVDLLKRAGVTFVLLGDAEPSSGRVALDIGDEERFDRQAERVAAAIRSSGADTVLCADALDFNTLRAHLPKVVDLGGVKVTHAVELLDQLVAQKRLVPRRPLAARVAYHDPDTLGRLSEPFQRWSGEIRKVMGQLVIYDPPRDVSRGAHGVYDPPRRLLSAIPGVELIEFQRRREYAFSCADQGVLSAAGYAEFVRNTALHRMEEASAVGAEIIASVCPSSEDNLASIAEGFSIRVENVIDLLHSSLAG